MPHTIQINLDLMEFVETQILPRYSRFDKAHNLSHIIPVVQRAVALAQKIGADLNMAYVAAAYHDLGMEGPRAVHHLTGGKILAADARLRKWFTPAQIALMKEAVEDHRASASHSPRNLYGKIVAEADRDLSADHVFSRAVYYGLDHHPQLDKEQQWQRFEQHVHNKYGRNGYMKLWIPGSDNEKHLQTLRDIIANPDRLRAIFEDIYDEEYAQRKAEEAKKVGKPS